MDWSTDSKKIIFRNQIGEDEMNDNNFFPKKIKILTLRDIIAILVCIVGLVLWTIPLLSGFVRLGQIDILEGLVIFLGFFTILLNGMIILYAKNRWRIVFTTIFAYIIICWLTTRQPGWYILYTIWMLISLLGFERVQYIRLVKKLS